MACAGFLRPVLLPIYSDFQLVLSLLWLLCRRCKICFLAPDIHSPYVTMVQAALSRPRGWRPLVQIAKTMLLKRPARYWELLPVSVLFVTVISAGFPTTTILIDARSINIGNSKAMQDLFAEWHGFIALLHGDSISPLVLKPGIAEGQGTVSFTFSALPKYDMGLLLAARCQLPLHSRGFHRRVYSQRQPPE